jgi:hypothetical protein
VLPTAWTSENSNLPRRWLNSLLASLAERFIAGSSASLHCGQRNSGKGGRGDESFSRQPGSTPTTSVELDRLRLRYGFWIIIAGFTLVFLITLISTFRWAEVTSVATSVATVVGAVATLVGTVVGAFFGVQVGALGKERADAARERSEEGIKAALSMLPPQAAEQLRAEMNR